MARLKQGMVQGPGTGTSDSILVRVSNGEYILPKAVVDLVGKKSLDKLRQQALAFQPVPKYAMGGEVNDTSLADSYNRATAITQETNKMLQGGTTPVAASTPAAPPANAFAQQQAAYNTARSNADPLDVASGRFDKGFARPSMPAKSPSMGAEAFASRQAAYNTAKSSADTLDVASGRFDKGYQPPRFADGGLVGDELEQATRRLRRTPNSRVAKGGSISVPNVQIPDVPDPVLKRSPDTRVVQGRGIKIPGVPNTPAAKMQAAAPAPVATPAPTPSPPRQIIPTVPENYNPLAPPTPAPASAPTPGNTWSQTLADKSIANRFQATNKAEAARATQAAAPVQPSPTRTPIATRAGQLNTQAGRFLPALEIGRGAWQTGKDIKERTSNGQGFWSAVGDTITGNIRKAADLTQGGTVEQLNAIAAERQAPGSDTAVAAQQAFTDKQAGQPTLGAMVDVVKSAPVAPAAPTPPPVAPTAPTPAASLQTQAGRMAGNNPQGRSFITGATPSTTEGGPTGEVFTSRGASPGQRMMDRSGATQAFKATVDGVRGSATGRSSNSRQGGFVGAATDAEAARNIQSRLEQDAAASQVVASMNRGAEAERDTRAAKLGISRAVLDQMEGRMDSPAVQALQERQNAQKPYEAMEQALSAYRNEQAAIERMRSGAPRGRPGDRVKREAVYKEADARAAAAENMLNAGLGVGKEQLSAETARQQARANAQAAQFQEDSQNRRAKLQSDATLEAARINQLGNLAREEAQQKGLTNRDAAKNYGDLQKEITGLQEKAFYGKEKEIDLTDFKSMLDELNEGVLVSTGMANNVEHARDIKAGKWRSPGEFQRALAAAKARKAGQPGWFKSFFSEGPDATSLYTGRSSTQ